MHPASFRVSVPIGPLLSIPGKICENMCVRNEDRLLGDRMVKVAGRSNASGRIQIPPEFEEVLEQTARMELGLTIDDSSRHRAFRAM